MVSLVMLQAAAVGLAKLGAGIGAGIAAVGAGLGIGKIGGAARSHERYPFEYDYYRGFGRGCCLVCRRYLSVVYLLS